MTRPPRHVILYGGPEDGRVLAVTDEMLKTGLVLPKMRGSVPLFSPGAEEPDGLAVVHIEQETWKWNGQIDAAGNCIFKKARPSAP